MDHVAGFKNFSNLEIASSGKIGLTSDSQVDLEVDIEQEASVHEKFYKLSPTQAQAILDLRLNKLTNLEQERIFSDYEASISEIKQYIKILTDTKELDMVMKAELDEVKNEYGEKRRSVVSNDEGLSLIHI